MNNIISTCTLIQKPQANETKWTSFAIANRSYTDRDGNIVITGMLYYLICHDMKVLPLIGKGTRLGIKGNFVGEWQENEKYPNSFSCGGPKIWVKDDEASTAFMVEVSSIVVLNKGTRVASTDELDLVHVVLVGKITSKGAEMRYTKSGQAITTASLAVQHVTFEMVDNTRVTTKYTVFFRLNIWGDRAESASKHWGANSVIEVEGDLEIFKPKDNDEKPTNAPTIWYAKDTEEPRASYEVRVNTWSFAPKSSNGGGSYTPARDQNYGTPAMDEEEIPF